jgi:two-component system, NarL family, sensor kinase
MDSKELNLIITVIAVITFIFIVMALILILIFSYHQKQKNKFSLEIKLMKEENEKTLLSTQLEIQEQTFNYIAEEIHDHIGQRLTLAKLYLNTRKEHEPQDTEQLVDQSAELIGMAINDLKYMSRTLTASFIKDNGLIPAITMETERINKLHQFNLHLLVEGQTVFMPAEKELVIFRIIQEALQNMMKHAKASKACITLNYGPAQLHITITDNGVGFHSLPVATAATKTSGLTNMEKRTTLLKGTFQITSSPNHGTTIQIQLPLNPTAAS